MMVANQSVMLVPPGSTSAHYLASSHADEQESNLTRTRRETYSCGRYQGQGNRQALLVPGALAHPGNHPASPTHLQSQRADLVRQVSQRLQHTWPQANVAQGQRTLPRQRPAAQGQQRGQGQLGLLLLIAALVLKVRGHL